MSPCWSDEALMKAGMMVTDDSPNICLVPNMEESSPILKLYGIKKPASQIAL